MSEKSQSKFEAEKAKVTILTRRLGHAVERYEDPNGTRGAAGESGADVVAVINDHRIGIQVTDLDTGKKPGKARAAESKLADAATLQGGTYFTWAQNDPGKVLSTLFFKAFPVRRKCPSQDLTNSGCWFVVAFRHSARLVRRLS